MCNGNNLYFNHTCIYNLNALKIKIVGYMYLMKRSIIAIIFVVGISRNTGECRKSDWSSCWKCCWDCDLHHRYPSPGYLSPKALYIYLYNK